MATRAEVALLYRRAGFGAPLSFIDTKTSMDWEDIVEELLAVDTTPIPRPSLFDEDLDDWELEYRLRNWWLDRMQAPQYPLQEKMTLFWHGHFATENSKVGHMELMWDQQALFREKGMGNFRTLVHEMSLQPAMLIYLDNASNSSDSPNENFARELMELFTLGVNQYTQQDIVASARAWTGHTIDWDDETTPHPYVFDADSHDDGNKRFMGVTRNWDGPDIIDFLLAENADTKRVAARFVATKLWRFFSYTRMSATLTNALTDAFYDSDLDLTALLRAIFNRPEFRTELSRTGLVRSPVEWIVALHRVLGVTAEDWNPWDMERMGQELFEPPNVAGWKRNDYWLATTMMWARANYISGHAWQINQMDPIPLQEIWEMTRAEAIDHILEVFEIDTPTDHTKATLDAWLRRERRADAWDHYEVLFASVMAALSPEFQLA